MANAREFTLKPRMYRLTSGLSISADSARCRKLLFLPARFTDPNRDDYDEGNSPSHESHWMPSESAPASPTTSHGSEELRTLSVLVPVFNERATVRKLIARVMAVPVALEIEIVVVDDGSTDGSREILSDLAEQQPAVRLFRHENNRGKGAAIRTAIERATGDVAIVQDADLEYDPAEIPKLLQPILAGEADAVFGSRFAQPRPAGDDSTGGSFPHRTANRLLTMVSNMTTGLRLTDMETCYKLMRMDVLRRLRLQANSFTIEPELTARLAQAGAVIREIPITYRGRTYAEGKKIGMFDFAKAFGEIVRSGIWDRRFSKEVDAPLEAAQKSD